MIRLYEEQGQGILRFVEEWMARVNFTWDDFHKPEHSGPVTDAILILKKQCEEGGGHEKDLIDTLVKHIATPIERITSRQLTQIRKAILLPSEYKVLQEEMDKKTMTCFYCEKELQRGETVSLMNAHSVACTVCANPEYVRCTNGHLREMPKSAQKSLRKAMTDCDLCKNEQEMAERGRQAVSYAEAPPLPVEPVFQQRPVEAAQALALNELLERRRAEIANQLLQQGQIQAVNVQNANWDFGQPLGVVQNVQNEVFVQNEPVGAGEDAEAMEDLLDELPEDEDDDRRAF